MINITSILLTSIYNESVKINKIWHVQNKMPKNPTLDEKVDWHVAHAKNCTCRPLSGKILEEIKKRGLYAEK